MKKATLIAVVAGLAAVATASASTPVYRAHDKEPLLRGHTSATPTSVPEPGSMALLALGLSGLGFAPLRRRLKK